MKKDEKKYKHRTYEDRLEIQECLSKGISFNMSLPMFLVSFLFKVKMLFNLLSF